MSTNVQQDFPALLTVREVSTAFRVSEKTVRRMIDRRELLAFRVGGQIRIHRDSFQHYLGARQVL